MAGGLKEVGERIKSVIKSKGVILTGNETLALVGHSNGGEAVPFAADAVRTGAVKSQFTSVKTVVQLAPSVPNFKLVNQYALNQLVIQGGLDGNVLPEGGVDHYEQFFGVTMVEKKAMPGTFQSLVFLHGGSHTGLSDIEYNNSCGALSYEGDPSTKKEIDSMLSYLGQSFVVEGRRADLEDGVDAFGVSENFSGAFTSGATKSNFAGLAMAREWVGRQFNKNISQEGLHSIAPIKVLSSEAHSSSFKALDMLGIGRGNMKVISKLNGNHEAMDISALKTALAELKGEPCIVIANAGTVNTVDFD